VLAFDVGGTHLRSRRWWGRTARSFAPLASTPQTRCRLVSALEEGRAQLLAARAAGGAAPVAGLAIAGCRHGEQSTSRPASGCARRRWGPRCAALGMPVRLVNDVNAAAVAEARAVGRATLSPSCAAPAWAAAS
jgi:predicted NBD/HSP70 family sugar kinase